MLTTEVESQTDYQAVADLGTRAFADPDITLSAPQIRFTYETAFSCGTDLVALKDDDKRVGQMALVRQRLRMDGTEHRAGQFVDLFIDKPWRNKSNIGQLYRAVEALYNPDTMRYALAVPNERAVGLNAHFFQMQKCLDLPVRAGLARPVLAPPGVQSLLADAQNRAAVITLGNRFRTPDSENGIIWDGETLANRLSAPDFTYALHATENLLLVSSPRLTRRLPHVLLCGFLIRDGAKPARSDIARTVAASTAFWRRPLFIYAGHYPALPALPGHPVPKRLIPTQKLLQIRDFGADGTVPSLDRFQLMDCDFV